jgi:hypothetical protein
VDRPGLQLRLARALAIGLIAGAVLPWSVAAADPELTPAGEATFAPAAPRAVPSRIDVNLYRPYVVVRQYTGYWCVPASAQAIVNIANGTSDRTYNTQARFAWHVNRFNKYTYPTRGNDPRGWARFLDYWLPGELHYLDRSYNSQSAAIAGIADAIDRSNRPVGIVVDRGTHAWTVLGYRGTVVRGDPTSRVIEGFYVTGPLHTVRGKIDPWPYRYMPLADFKLRFTRYHESTRAVVWEGKFVIVSE